MGQNTRGTSTAWSGFGALRVDNLPGQVRSLRRVQGIRGVSASTVIRRMATADRGDPSGDHQGCARDPWHSRGAFQLSLSLVQEN